MTCRAGPNVFGCSVSGGFTLLELQLAIAILALMASVLFGVLTLGSDTWRAVVSVSEQGDKQLLVQQFLRRQLQHSAAEWLRDEERQRQVSFVGGSQWLSFVAPPPQASGNHQLYWWTLSVSQDLPGDHAQGQEVNEAALVISYRPFDESEILPAVPDLSWRQRADAVDEGVEILEQYVSHMRVEYLQQNADGRKWLDDWQAQKTLPVAVRISLVGQALHHSWPPLVVVLRQSSFSRLKRAS